MFERPHHQRIAHVLSALDGGVLAQLSCWFGGGTCIALKFGEYRESVDIDFLVSDPAGSIAALWQDATTDAEFGFAIKAQDVRVDLGRVDQRRAVQSRANVEAMKKIELKAKLHASKQSGSDPK